MPKQMIEIEIPEGYEFVEFREVRKGDVYMANFTPNHLVAAGDHNNDYKYPILRKTERWRPAAPADVQYPRKKARFRDSYREEWKHSDLLGVEARCNSLVWRGTHNDNFHYWHCEVLCD